MQGLDVGAWSQELPLMALVGPFQLRRFNPTTQPHALTRWRQPVLTGDCWEPGSRSEHIIISLITGRSPRTAFLLRLRWAEKTHSHTQPSSSGYPPAPHCCPQPDPTPEWIASAQNMAVDSPERFPIVFFYSCLSSFASRCTSSHHSSHLCTLSSDNTAQNLALIRLLSS